MGKYMMVNGSKGSNMDTEFGQVQTAATLTSESGSILRLKDMAYTNGKTVIDMKESGNSV